MIDKDGIITLIYQLLKFYALPKFLRMIKKILGF